MRRTPAGLLAILVVVAAPAHARDPGGRFADDCGLEPPGAAIDPPPAKSGGGRVTGAAVRRARGGGGGALAGKTIYVSPGHGWTWIGTGWSTQRGNTNGIVEDLVSAEAVDTYLIDTLRRMGAHVVPLREPDPNPNLVIVDDVDAILEGSPVVDGATDPGFAPPSLPIDDGSDHFTAGTAQRLTTTNGAPRGAIVFPIVVPEDGTYNLYVTWVQGPDRATDAHVGVRHGAGETDLRIDQRRHGGTWVLLGRFWLDADAPPEESAIAIYDDSASGGVVSVDAVRAGGGADLVDRGGGVAGRPMVEHCARYYALWNGAPADVYDYRDGDGDDDVVTRSRFAAWDHEDGEDAIYIAWHTNAPNPAVGTSSYTYGPSPPPGPLDEFTGVPGSLELQALVHGEIVGDLRAVWDAGWSDRGMHTAYFGEVNPAHNPEMPAVLVEVAFHDTPADAAQLREPTFRRIVTRAMAQGIARYFAERDGVTLVLPPEPPTALRVENDGGALRVSWRPPPADPAGGDAPAGYRVYTSRDGRAFDEGVEVDGETLSLGPLAAGAVRFVRVTAVNDGGESAPTEIVGGRVAAAGAAQVLVVGGFDRLDAALLPVEDLSAYGLGLVDRAWLDRINDGTYAVRHGAAIAAAGVSFDGASDEAIAQGDVDLAGYRAVDWFAGEESAGDEPFTIEQRGEVAAYVAAGGRLFVSGSEIGWALDFLGATDEIAFFRDVLHATYAADDAETYAIAALEGPYGGLAPFDFDDRSRGAYDAEWPDVLDPGIDAFAALDYAGGSEGHAAIAWRGGAGDRGVLFGFPFETIRGEDRREEVMARTLAFLEVEPEDFPPDGGVDGGSTLTGDEGGCGCRVARRGAQAGGGVLAILVTLGLTLAARTAKRIACQKRPRRRPPDRTPSPSRR